MIAEAATFIVTADTLDTVRDVVIIVTLLSVFVFLVVFAVLGIILFRQVRRMASRVETALIRVDSVIEKFELASSVVSGFAGSLAGLITKGTVAGLGKMFGRIFGSGGEVEDGDGKKDKPVPPGK